MRNWKSGYGNIDKGYLRIVSKTSPPTVSKFNVWQMLIGRNHD